MKNVKCLFIAAAMLFIAACGESSNNSSQATTGPVNDSTSLGNSGAGGSSGAGNGGGAIVRNGNLLTFAQAGVKFEIPVVPVFNDPGITVPEIAIAESFAQRLALPDLVKLRLLRALVPLGERKYFNLQSADLSPEKKAQLLAAYQKTVGQLPLGENFEIVAVTIGKETFLLPEFYQLTDSIAKAAIILHEALWVYNPKLPLVEVLRTEVALENALRSPLAQEKLIYEKSLFDVLTRSLGSKSLLLTGALLADLANGPFELKIPTLNPADQWSLKVQSPEILIQDILGHGYAFETWSDEKPLDKEALEYYWNTLVQLNPSSKFAKALLDSLGDFRIITKSVSSFYNCTVDFTYLQKIQSDTGLSCDSRSVISLD
ncbi:MAG: hypothetical protein ACOYOK_05185 [Pseudobdellovibrionaceae bacterium]